MAIIFLDRNLNNLSFMILRSIGRNMGCSCQVQFMHFRLYVGKLFDSN